MFKPLISSQEMLIVVPQNGEGYAWRQCVVTPFDALEFCQDNTEDFIRFDPFYLVATSIREPIARAFLEKYLNLDPDFDVVPPFVWASKAWDDYVAQK